MRIDVICADRGIAPDGTKGASIHLRAVATTLATQGHDVTLFTARTPVDDIGVNCRPLDALDERSNAERPDFVYERLSLGHRGGLDAARTWGCPFGLEVNAPLVAEATHYRPATVRPEHDATERELIRDADLVFAVSEPLRTWLSRVRGTSAGVHTVRNGVDATRFPIAADATRKPPVLAFLGDPKPWHGAERLVPLLAAVRERHDASLLLIGGGDGADCIVAEARARNLDSHVFATGRVSPKVAARQLADASIGLAPYPPCKPLGASGTSATTGTDAFYFCPLKVIEYLACGLPVVTTRQGDLPEIVGDAGVLVDADATSAAWADAVSGLIADPQRSARLGAYGRRRAMECFTWERAADTLTGLMQQLVAGPTR